MVAALRGESVSGLGSASLENAMRFCGSDQHHHALGPKSIIIRMSQLKNLELRGPHVNQGNPRHDELQPDNTTEGFVS